MLGPRHWIRLGLTLFLFAAAPGRADAGLPIAVAAPDATHIAWISVQRLGEFARERGVELAPALASSAGQSVDAAALKVVPVREIARTLPELSALELPFFYSDLPAVHRALDGEFGAALKTSARERGWELLAVWDEGLQLMSGNIAYTDPFHLRGAEFVLLREDPIAEIELRALDSWSRSARPDSLIQLQKECLVSSRSASAQQMVRERLARVHLDVTLSRHRYEGWAVAMPVAAWAVLKPSQRDGISAALRALAGWQRDRALEEEQAALRALVKDGMTTHPLAAETWQRYRAMQPDWERFLPAGVQPDLWRRLVMLAAGASSIGAHLVPRVGTPPRETNPRTP